jgi:hypothetical protein
MSMSLIQSFHDDAKFRELAKTASIERVVAEYEALGVRFFFIDRAVYPTAPPSCYSTEGGARDVYLDANVLGEFGVSPSDGLAYGILHELGHFEAHRHQLNRACELLAWDFATELALKLYIAGLPGWWAPVRRVALATYRIEWDQAEAKVCRTDLCTHHPSKSSVVGQ